MNLRCNENLPLPPRRLSLEAITRNPDQQVVSERRLRSLADDEAIEIWSARRLILRLTHESPLSDFEDATSDLVAGFEQFAGTTAEAGRQSYDRETRRLQRGFLSWLTSFSSFVDRTKAMLSREFAEQPDVGAEFERLLSREFDGNFAYRLCAVLRNQAAHAGDTINHVVFLQSDDGQVVVHIGVDCRELAPRLSRKARPATRAEMVDVSAPVSVHLLVQAVLASCVRAYFDLVVYLWPTVLPAVELLDSLGCEAVAAGADEVSFAVRPNLDAVARAPIGRRYQLPTWLSESLRETYEESVARGRISMLVTWRDLALPQAPEAPGWHRFDYSVTARRGEWWC